MADKSESKRAQILRVVVLCALCAVLVYLAWSIFFRNAQDSATTPTEQRLETILSEISGAGKTKVYVHTDDSGTVTGVIVVAEGANSLMVVSDLTAAVSTALGIDRSAIRIYPM